MRDGKLKDLGKFETPEMASFAYQKEKALFDAVQ
jgi:hypothetical protein